MMSTDVNGTTGQPVRQLNGWDHALGHGHGNAATAVAVAASVLSAIAGSTGQAGQAQAWLDG